MEIAYWHWLSLGVLLFALEIVVPGAILMWFGFGAIVTGIVLWLIPSFTLAAQLIVFVILSIISLLAWRKSPWYKDETTPSDTPGLNNRLQSHIGKVYMLSTPIINGRGSVEVDGSIWQVQGADLPAGTRVKVVSLDGTFFNVTAAE
ncbi:MAG: NfeD family protein [Thiofilum sp.]|uniref:NfeD family protein n=1 Tax=Thiofilum sp. TaxID=2212733 RepID=UPI0025E386BD|nr:NfeD family protein [Thiofilum sp.]MBK8452279.1 NfeD family protein [Thiofilum sp.]